jgi:hypothetical protein
MLIKKISGFYKPLTLSVLRAVMFIKGGDKLADKFGTPRRVREDDVMRGIKATYCKDGRWQITLRIVSKCGRAFMLAVVGSTPSECN